MKSFKINCHIVVRIFIDLSDCTYFDLLLSVVRRGKWGKADYRGKVNHPP